MSTFITLALILAAILGIWAGFSWYAIQGLEQPTYTVLETQDGYEVRQYEPYLVAETTITTEDESEALNQGFSIIADYIFGNNTVSQEIAMTTPVTSKEGESQKIAMTTPVTSVEDSASSSRTIAFIMPSKYTLESIPKPNDERVNLREVPAQVMAVRQFSWFAGNERIEEQKGKLRSSLTENQVNFVSGMRYAGYNPPLSAPFMRRHEVAAIVEWDGFPLETNDESNEDNEPEPSSEEPA